ncbi:MAG: hypothetical protein IT460_07830 [Planctomycetes bacterium]|nr:hypothetical protein [Planctomycetota bacterium]
MFKRVVTLALAAAALFVAGCSSCNSCKTPSRGATLLHCDPPCYGKALQRSARQVMDVVDVHFLNYDRHDPYRCDPCIGN